MHTKKKNSYSISWQKDNPDKVRESVKKYRSRPEIKEKYKAAAKKWREQNKERAKEIHEKCVLKTRTQTLQKLRAKYIEDSEYRIKQKQNNKRCAQKRVESLSDSYVMSVLTQNNSIGISKSDIPKELIILKRNSLKIKRNSL